MSIQFLPIEEQHLDSVWQIEQQAHSHPWKESMVRQLETAEVLVTFVCC